MSARLPSAADSAAIDVGSSTGAGRSEREPLAGSAPRLGRQRLRVPPLWCPIVFAIACVGLAVMRAVVLLRGGAPATVDSGNWLAFGHALLGSHVRSSTIVYPPVVPLILTSVSSVFGARVAVGLVGALSSLAPGAGVYWVLRRAELQWSAVAIAVLVTAAGSTGESTAWGGFPQLLGLGGMVVALWLLDEWLTEPTWRRGLAAGAALLFVGATSDIVFGATLVCAVFVAVIRTLAGNADTVKRASRALRTAPYVVLPMVPLIPLYWRLIEATRQTGPDHVGSKLTLSEAPSAVEFLYRDLPWPWRLALVSAVVAPLLFADRWRDRLWIVATSLLVTASVTTVVLHEDRFLYVLPLGVALGLGLWARELAWAPLPFMRRFRPVLGAALAVFVVAQIVTGTHAFGAQRDYYGVLDPGSTAAIEWISHNTPRGSLVAAPTVRGAPLGWWVEGLGRRQSLLASALRWLNFPDEIRRAREANAVFSADFPDDATIAKARLDGVDYVLVPLASELVDPVRLRLYVKRNPQQVAYRNNTTYVLRL